MRTISGAILSGVLLCGVLLATAGRAQGPAAASEEGLAHRPVKHSSVCPGPASPDSARCHAHIVVDDSGSPLASAGPSGYAPADLRSAYNITATGSTGTIIAIVDAYGYPNAESDLATYRSQFGLPACTTANGCFKKLNQSGVQGSYPRTDTGWSQESALDLDMASAMCPNCKLILVEASSSSFQNLATAVSTAASFGAHVISNSYGGGESGSAAYEPYYNLAGVAVTVSSGDGGYGVEFPASSPHVIAVGGTSLSRSSSSRGWSETAWSGAGSGCSAYEPKPSWQKDGGCARRTVAGSNMAGSTCSTAAWLRQLGVQAEGEFHEVGEAILVEIEKVRAVAGVGGAAEVELAPRFERSEGGHDGEGAVGGQLRGVPREACAERRQADIGEASGRVAIDEIETGARSGSEAIDQRDDERVPPVRR